MVPTHTAGWTVRRRIADTILPLRILPGRHLYMFWLDA